MTTLLAIITMFLLLRMECTQILNQAEELWQQQPQHGVPSSAGRWVMVVAVGVGWCLNGGGACGSGWVMGRGKEASRGIDARKVGGVRLWQVGAGGGSRGGLVFEWW